MPGMRFCQRCGTDIGMYNQAPMNGYAPQQGNMPRNQGPNQAYPQYGQQMPPQQMYRQTPAQQQPYQPAPMQQAPPIQQQQYQQPQYSQQMSPQQNRPSTIQPYQSSHFTQQPQTAPAPKPEAPKKESNSQFSIRFSEHEIELLSAYASFNKTTVTEFVRKAAMEKLNMEFAKRSADNAYNVYMSDPGTYTLEEVMNSYDL